MNYKEFKKNVDKMNKNISTKLKDNEEELAFYTKLVKRFNDICKENEELKKQLEVGEEQYNNLVEEKEKLEEQLSSITLELEEYKKQVNKGLYSTCLPYKTGYDKAVEDYKKQQQEFIKYLEDEIKACKAVSDLLFNSNKEMKVYKEILQKYKGIIGVEDEQ